MPSNFGQQPLELISNILTMNSTDDPTSLREGEAQLLQNMVRAKGVLQVREGMTKLNAGAGALAAQPYGLSTFKPLDSETMQYVSVNNARIYGGSSFPLTSILTGMTASTKMQLLPYRGVMLVNDPSQGLAYYDGSTAGWAGCPSPREFKSIDGFESVTGWSTTNGTATLVDTNVIQGRHAVKFQANSGATYAPRKTITLVDLTSFAAAPVGDGATSTTYDYIRLRLTRSARSDFTSCTLNLYTNAGLTEKYAAILSDIQEWISSPMSGATFDLLIRKSIFTSTSGNWATVQAVEFSLVAATGCTPWITCDFIQLERSGPVAWETRKTIAEMEADETWTKTAGAGSFTYNSIYKKSLARSMQITNAATIERTVSLNLTTFDNGEDAATMDTIQFDVAKDTTKNVAGTLDIRFYFEASNYYSLTAPIVATDIKGTAISANLYKKLESTKVCFTTFSRRKDQFTASGGTPSWAAITKVVVVTSAHAGDFYLDSINLTKTRDKRVVVSFEPTATNETISVTNATKSGWADPRDEIEKIRTEEGSTTSYFIEIAKDTVCTIDITLSADIDVSTFVGGGSVQDQDMLGPLMWCENSKNIENIDILYDTATGTYAHYYIKSFPGASMAQIKKGWLTLRAQINEHLRVGSTGGWNTVQYVRIQITTSAKGGGTSVWLDQLAVERSEAVSGSISYRVRYQNARGAKSDYSNLSNKVELRNGSVLLSNLPTSTGMLRIIEKFVSTQGLWYVAGYVNDDSTVTFQDRADESTLPEVGSEKIYQKPLIAGTLGLFKDIVLLGNLTDQVGNKYPSDISISKEYSFEEFSPADMFSIGKDDGFKLMTFISAFDRVYALKEKGVWSFDPYNLSQTPVLIDPDIGIAGKEAWAKTDRGFAFLTTNKDLLFFDGSSFKDIGRMEGGLGNVQSYLDAIPDAYVGGVVMASWKQFLLVGITSSGGTYNDRVLCLYIPESSWTIFTGWNAALFHISQFSGAAKLMMGTQDTFIYQLFSGNDDAGTEITGTIRTPEMAKDFTLFKNPGTMFLTAAAISTDPTIQVTPYYDGTAGTALAVLTISSATHYRAPTKTIPAAPKWATYLGFLLTLTKRSSLRGAAYTVQEETRQ